MRMQHADSTTLRNTNLPSPHHQFVTDHISHKIGIKQKKPPLDVNKILKTYKITTMKNDLNLEIMELLKI